MIHSESSQTAWHARLELEFERRGDRTVLTRNRHEGPLLVQKALYPEDVATCHVAVLHPPGGIVAGDDLLIDASLPDSCQVLMTTPGATKWYRTDGAAAQQRVHFRLGADAIVEWLPRESIFFNRASPTTSLEVVLSAGSKYFGWEILCFGRRASGERWSSGRLQMRTSIRRYQSWLWSEVADIDAANGFDRSEVGLAGFAVCGTFIVAGVEIGEDLLAACRRMRRESDGSRGGITRLPSLLVVRYLGDSTEECFNWFAELWRLMRPVLTGRTACTPRLWAC